ncbi:FxSxx-COOH system tetratricopeptide repeat protein [Streptacidiphilus sp. EB103A]|uniref:FxSxx-COOH system tetratricopeptide repeat protein n=1 Tax=Streptacidiphilus sp. EB103A TaxID=3156275 RepID=UPI003519D10F
MSGEDVERRVFISHAGPDRAWAEWVAWQLEDAGYTTELDYWDWAAGENFILKMNDALKSGRMVALFSAAYFEPGRFTTDEWTAVLAAKDKGKLVPVRIDATEPPPILAPILAASIHGLEEAQARAALLGAVAGPRRPDHEPAFPGPGGGRLRRLGATSPRLPGTLPRVWNLPARNAGFTGRDDVLLRLRQALTSHTTVALQAGDGRGGIGKTQLALEYAYRFAGDYELTWWIRAEEPGLIPDQLTALAVRTGAAPADTTPADAWDALAADLRSRGRWLLVFDNAEDPAALRPYLPGGTGHVLITSRNRQWHTIAHAMDVYAFTRPESVHLLRTRVPTLTEQDADRLAQALDDLPLALVQAAASLDNGLTLTQYHQLLNAQASALLDQDPPDDYPVSLAAQTRLSHQRLTHDNPDAALLLNACALLAPEPFPLHNCTAHNDAPATLNTLLGKPLSMKNALTAVTRHALGRVQDGTLQLHRLTQAILRDQLDDQQRTQAAHSAEALLVAARPGDVEEPANWPAWSDLGPHLLTVDPHDITTEAGRDVVRDGCARLIDRGDAMTAIHRLEELHQVWGEQLGPDHEGTLWTANYLANAYSAASQHERARELDQDTYQRRRRILGDDHPDTLASAGNLAIRLAALGDTQAAADLARDTYHRRKGTLGDDHPHTLTSAHSLAIRLAALGDTQAAADLGRDTYHRRKHTLGEDHPHTLAGAHNLAIDLAALGDTQAAADLGRDTYDRRKGTLGEDHPDTLTSAHSLAIWLADLGDTQAAADLGRDTYHRRKHTLGDDHPDTLSTAHSLANRLAKLGDTQAAADLARDTYHRCKRTLGDDHPDTLSAAHNLAIDLAALGDTQAAADLGQDTYHRRKGTLGEDHPDTLSTAHNLAIDLAALGDTQAAADLGQDTYHRRKHTLGEDHHNTLASQGLLARLEEGQTGGKDD